ncbi:methyl-accepting chemotaxis protein [Saccharicrinis aurantiacus]|uniref:methyl-accepting chemotaxis protein n=1 Tax=Saccharicrinis aurantiacus TaxID=1849719 RepID=UPI00248FB236|nr:methyl-accepting chemotaxis protein [Saccharicrinis aurantiacus]
MIASIASAYVMYSNLNHFLIGFSIALLTIIILVRLLKKQITGTIAQLKDEILAPIAKGHLSNKIDESFLNRKDEFGEIGNTISNIKNQQQELIQYIKRSSNQVLKIVESNNQDAAQLADSANEQAASTEELSSTLLEVMKNANISLKATNDSASLFKQLQIDVNHVNDVFNNNLESINKIANKVVTLNNIAAETNILALNASIEASRAGEIGKGFGVVAGEVKSLAEFSSDAAEQINIQIAETIGLSDNTSNRLIDLLKDIDVTSELSNEALQLSNQQNIAMDQVNSTTSEISSLANKNAITAEKMQTSTDDLKKVALELNQLVNNFTVD